MSDVYDEVKAEREAQDREWGGPAHDDGHDDADWLEFIAIKERAAEWVRGRRPYDATERRELRYRLIQIAALAVAGVESIDRRMSADPEAP